MSHEHLITTPPTLTVCATCRRPVLAAVISGLERHVDPAALNAEGVRQATGAGLALFVFRGEHLYRLTRHHVEGGEPLTVMAEHTHHQIPDSFIDGSRMGAAIELVTRLLGATPVTTDEPPF